MTWPINSVIDLVNNPLRASPVLRAPLMLRSLRWTGPDTRVVNHEKQMSGVRVHSHARLCGAAGWAAIRVFSKGEIKMARKTGQGFRKRSALWSALPKEG